MAQQRKRRLIMSAGSYYDQMEQYADSYDKQGEIMHYTNINPYPGTVEAFCSCGWSETYGWPYPRERAVAACWRHERDTDNDDETERATADGEVASAETSERP